MMKTWKNVAVPHFIQSLYNTFCINAHAIPLAKGWRLLFHLGILCSYPMSVTVNL